MNMSQSCDGSNNRLEELIEQKSWGNILQLMSLIGNRSVAWILKRHSSSELKMGRGLTICKK